MLNITTQKRTAKEYLLKKDGKCQIKYGTLNKTTPSVLFVHIKGVVTPTVKQTCYRKELTAIKSGFSKTVANDVGKLDSFSDKCICTIDINDNRMTIGKKCGMKYEIFLKPKVVRPMEEYEGEILEIVEQANHRLRAILEENHMEME